MPIPKNDKHKDYARYAAHCLDMVTTTKDQEARAINREMASDLTHELPLTSFAMSALPPKADIP